MGSSDIIRVVTNHYNNLSTRNEVALMGDWLNANRTSLSVERHHYEGNSSIKEYYHNLLKDHQNISFKARNFDIEILANMATVKGEYSSIMDGEEKRGKIELVICQEDDSDEWKIYSIKY